MVFLKCSVHVSIHFDLIREVRDDGVRAGAGTCKYTHSTHQVIRW